MRGPMLRFAIVSFLLLVLVIFYATRLGDGEEPSTEPESAPVSDADSSSPMVEAPVTQTDEAPRDWFPDLTDRNDLPGVNLGTRAARDTFGCDISDLSERIGMTRKIDDEQYMARLMETFAVSGDVELQLAGGHLTITTEGTDVALDRHSREASVERAYQTDPLNPLVLWNAVEICSGGDSSEFCGDPRLQANIETVLGNNGEYWVRVAERRHEQNDRVGALEALRRAGTAPEFDNYVVDNIRMFQRAFSMVPDTSYTVQTLAAYALANAIVHRSANSMGCGADVEADPEWLDACLAIAARYEAEGRTITQQRMGATIRARLLELAGQQDEAEASRARQRELTDMRDMLEEDVAAVMLTDERVMALFLEEFETGNEFSAMFFLRDEVERLKQDPSYDPCPSDRTAD